VTVKILEPIQVTPDKVKLYFPGATLRQLKVSGAANFEVSTGQRWLKAERKGQTIMVSADPTGKSGGIYQGSIAVKDQEDGTSLNVQVVLQVLAQ
jgi:hypothetical protein